MTDMGHTHLWRAAFEDVQQGPVNSLRWCFCLSGAKSACGRDLRAKDFPALLGRGIEPRQCSWHHCPALDVDTKTAAFGTVRSDLYHVVAFAEYDGCQGSCHVTHSLSQGWLLPHSSRL